MTTSRGQRCYIRAYLFFPPGRRIFFFSFRLINFAHDDAWLASRSWIISHTLPHRRSSPAHGYKRKPATFSCKEYYWRSVDRGWAYPDYVSARARRRGNWTFFRHGRCVPSLRWNYTPLHLYAHISRFRKPIFVAHEYSPWNLRVERYERLRFLFSESCDTLKGSVI